MKCRAITSYSIVNTTVFLVLHRTHLTKNCNQDGLIHRGWGTQTQAKQASVYCAQYSLYTWSKMVLNKTQNTGMMTKHQNALAKFYLVFQISRNRSTELWLHGLNLQACSGLTSVFHSLTKLKKQGKLTTMVRNNRCTPYWYTKTT